MLLQRLRIRQLAIIEDLTVEFGPGLNLLTGETGAGKSILVDALGLAFGGRADRSQIRAGARRSIVEAEMASEGDTRVREWAAELGLEQGADEDTIVIRREISGSGGKASFNGSPCTQGMLRAFGRQVLELHGQHEQQGLLRAERRRELLDHFGGHLEQLASVARAHAEAARAAAELDSLREETAHRARRVEELEQTVREIEKVGPLPGELESLDRDRRRMRHAAEINELVESLVVLLLEGEPAASGLASAAARQARRLSELDPLAGELAERIAAASLELQEAGSSFRDLRARDDFHPQRLEELELRRRQLERLRLLYGPDETAALDRAEQARGELAALRGIGERRCAARDRLYAAREAYLQQARQLSRARSAASARLVPAVQSQLAELALEKARFEVRLLPAPARDAGEEPSGAEDLDRGGLEAVEFLLAANPGEPPRELGRVASGGELSRVMLALHALGPGEGAGRIFVFDEVDVGIGGRVADAVGARLAALAREHQVLCVTHLPQVAAYAERHLVVSKREVGGRNVAQIEAVEGERRVEELARMLGGRKRTAAARRNATEMLAAAGRIAAAGRSE